MINRPFRMCTLCPFATRVRQECLKAARQWKPVTYGTIADRLGLDRRNRAHLGRIIQALREISLEDHRAGRPLAAVAVVAARLGVPGRGFFRQARELGRLSPGIDDRQFVAAEWARLRAACAPFGPAHSPHVVVVLRHLLNFARN